jgi:hypothetical protein
MKTHHIILSWLIVSCHIATAQVTNTPTQTNATTIKIETTPVATPSEKKLPTWYVFKIKAFHKVTFSEDRTFAIVEGVTMKDKEFKVKLVWAQPFKNSHPKVLDRWLKKSKADFEAGIPYIIAGKVISRDPLTIEPDTVVGNAPNWGAPSENVY